jgi:hypothetical protein
MSGRATPRRPARGEPPGCRRVRRSEVDGVPVSGEKRRPTQVDSNDELKEVRPRLAHFRSARELLRKRPRKKRLAVVTLTPGLESLLRALPRCFGRFEDTGLDLTLALGLGKLYFVALLEHPALVADRGGRLGDSLHDHVYSLAVRELTALRNPIPGALVESGDGYQRGGTRHRERKPFLAPRQGLVGVEPVWCRRRGGASSTTEDWRT